MRAVVVAFAAASIVSALTWKSASVLVVSVGEVGTGAFIKDAEVRLVEANRTARTAWDGEARFTGLSGGRVHVQVRAIGFAPGDVDAQVSGDSSAVHFELERASVALDTVRVKEAERVRPALIEYETRRKQNIGRFLTDSMLRDDRSRSLQYMLAARLPGLQVREQGLMSMQPSGIRGDNECPVLIYLDGFKITDVDALPRGTTNAPPSRLNPKALNDNLTPVSTPGRAITPLDAIQPDSLIGVEYYSRTSAPVEYKPVGNYCKVILLWTRR